MKDDTDFFERPYGGISDKFQQAQEEQVILPENNVFLKTLIMHTDLTEERDRECLNIAVLSSN